MGIFNLAYLSHYVRTFLLDMKSLPCPHEDIVVALSGGRDSVLLLNVMAYFKRKKWINNLSAVHIDYLSWGERRLELRKDMNKLCRKEGIDLKVFERKLDKQSSNFEMKAREIRFKEFETFIDEKTWIVLGHHITDSLEWSLMQQIKTSSPRSMLGIPLKRGRYLRPFMCLTRDHITTFCRLNRIAYRDDPSDDNYRFERNWIRGKIVGPLKKAYPKIEKHYVLRHNQLALQYGLHPKSQKSPSDNGLLIKKIYDGIVMIDHRKHYFLGRNDAIITAVKSLSPERRGKQGKEVAKVSKALQNGRQGPFVLSGGVHLYLAFHRLLLVKNPFDWFRKLDRTMTAALNLPSSLLSLKEVTDKKISRENIFTQYIVLKPFSSKSIQTALLSQAHVRLKSFNAVIKRKGLVVADCSKLLRLCQKYPLISDAKIVCFYK